jgi:multicomponent Na+:H+ antiporter subunit A
VPRHLQHLGRPAAEAGRFHALMLLFMGAMVGTVMAQDLVLLFVFWDLTAVASYVLIGFDRERGRARRAALTALVVTGVTSILFMVGAMMLHAAHGTLSVPALVEQARAGPALTIAVALLVVAALAKSAQPPFHFWLPRAMVAPTPVSAYLHSAAMVAAGVFLLSRLLPLIARSPGIPRALIAVGLLAMLVGGGLALARDRLKQVLAYSTVAQYGYVVVMLGVGGEAGAAGAAIYVIAHGLAKSALFLTAGAVTEATGEDRISRLGGLGRRMPALALASAVAAATLAGLPLTIGFFKDELFLAAAAGAGPALGLAALAGAALTFTYVWRFWWGVFGGQGGPDARALPGRLTLPVAGLAAVALVAGVVPGPAARLAGAAAGAMLGAGVSVDLAYHLEPRPASLMALGAWALGILLIVRPGLWRPAARGLAWAGARFGPDRAFRTGRSLLDRASTAMMAIERRDLRTRIAAVLVPCAGLVGLAVAVSATWTTFRVGTVAPEDVPLALALVITAVAALGATRRRGHFLLVLALSATGFSLCLAYAFFGAPDVALVAVLVEMLLALVFLGVLTLLPRPLLARQAARRDAPGRRWRNPLLGGLAGAFAFAVAWSTLSRPDMEASASRAQLALAPRAHGQDVVTVILTDFRGLDTAGEITVLAITLVGITTVLGRRGRR